jgi:hypothetical protein
MLIATHSKKCTLVELINNYGTAIMLYQKLAYFQKKTKIINARVK